MALDFERLYATYQPDILRLIERLTSPCEAADLTQEVFLKAGRSLQEFRGESNVSTWLYRIAINTVADRAREASYRHAIRSIPADPDVADDIEDRDGSGVKREPLDLGIIRKEMNECIRDIIRNLPAEHRIVIALKDMQGLSHEEIASILQISAGNVKIRLHRARACLRKELEAQCIFYRDHRNEFACDRKSTMLPFRRTL
ncbi:MAG: sigma-70 family RNA polymerase sigma factor [Nitrospirota bacterium]